MRQLVTLSLGLVFLVGCGPKPPTTAEWTGTITYKGQPVNGALLTLYPSGASQSITYPVPVNQEGTFAAAGMPADTYMVVVQGSSGMAGLPSTQGMDPAKLAEQKAKLDQMQAQARPTIPFPDKYKFLQATPLKVTLTVGKQTQNLELAD
jgi:hypothetical protein